MMMKTCKICNIEKEEEQYYNQKNYKDGLDPMCIECRKKSNKEYHDAHRQKIRDRSAQWRKDNYERDVKQKREYYLRKKAKKNEVRD
jgi:hypothetical protein